MTETMAFALVDEDAAQILEHAAQNNKPIKGNDIIHIQVDLYL
jgi:hypothetical protein